MRSRAIAASAAITLGLVMMGTSAYGAPDSLADPAVEQSSDAESAQNAPETKTEKTVASPAENAATSTIRKAETPADQGAGSAASGTSNPATQVAQAKAPANDAPAAQKDTPAPAPSTTENQQSAPKSDEATAPSATENTAPASPAPAPSTPAPSAQTPSTPEESTAPEPAEPAESETATSTAGTDAGPTATNTPAEKETAAKATEKSAANDQTGSIATNAPALPAQQKSVEKAVEKVAGANSEVGALTAAQIKAVAAAACPNDAVCADASGVASIYTTVQDAITAAQEADKSKVVILSGDYAPFTVAFAMQIMAAAGADVKVHTDPTNNSVAITVDSDNVSVTGLQVVCQQTTNNTTGVQINNVTGVTISGLKTSNCERGVSLANASYINILNSSFTGYQGGDNSAAIWGDNTQDVLIDGNTFTNQDTGTNFDDFNELIIANNKFSGMGTASVFANGTNGSFVGNKVSDTSGSAVYITAVDGFLGAWNTFTNGAGDGFKFDVPSYGGPSSNIRLIGNVFNNMGDWAINFVPGSLALGTNATVAYNDFSNTKKAIQATDAGAQVNAATGNYFGVCGATALNQPFNGGGATAAGSSDDLLLDTNGCETIPTPDVEYETPVCRADGSEEPGEFYLPSSRGTTYVADDGTELEPGYYTYDSGEEITIWANPGRMMWYGPDDFSVSYTIPATNLDCQRGGNNGKGGKGSITPVTPGTPAAPNAPEAPAKPMAYSQPGTSQPLATSGPEGTLAMTVFAVLFTLAGGTALFFSRRWARR